jgi:hypothetical protein
MYNLIESIKNNISTNAPVTCPIYAEGVALWVLDAVIGRNYVRQSPDVRVPPEWGVPEPETDLLTITQSVYLVGNAGTGRNSSIDAGIDILRQVDPSFPLIGHELTKDKLWNRATADMPVEVMKNISFEEIIELDLKANARKGNLAYVRQVLQTSLEETVERPFGVKYSNANYALPSPVSRIAYGSMEDLLNSYLLNIKADQPILSSFLLFPHLHEIARAIDNRPKYRDGTFVPLPLPPEVLAILQQLNSNRLGENPIVVERTEEANELLNTFILMHIKENVDAPQFNRMYFNALHNLSALYAISEDPFNPINKKEHVIRAFKYAEVGVGIAKTGAKIGDRAA